MSDFITKPKLCMVPFSGLWSATAEIFRGDTGAQISIRLAGLGVSAMEAYNDLKSQAGNYGHILT